MKNAKQKLQELMQKCDIELLKNGLVVVGIITIWRAVWDAVGLQNQLASSLIAIGIGILLLHGPIIRAKSLSEYAKSKK